MSAIRSQHTAPEMVVRHLLHGMEYRYRVHRRDLPEPDDHRPGAAAMPQRLDAEARAAPACKERARSRVLVTA